MMETTAPGQPSVLNGRFRTAGLRLILGISLLTLAAVSRVSAFDTVILDPGHGGHDRGAGIGYVYEKHLALDTARRVQQLLQGAGLKVILSRSSDVFITLEDRSRLGNSRSNAVFVSVHYNYNRSGSGHGIETYYCHEDSYRLAAYIQAYSIMQTGLTNRGVKSANFHVIRVTNRNPAVLVECGFVSNSAERASMMYGDYREKIAMGIAKGIIAFHKE